MRYLLFCLLVTSCFSCTNSVFAQVNDSKSPFEGQELRALYEEQVRNKLALDEEQNAAIKEFGKELESFSSSLREEYERSTKDLSEDAAAEIREKLVAQYMARASYVNKELKALLLPHQRTRLRELTAQVLVRESTRKHLIGVFTPEMQSYLGIDEKQAEKIKKRAEEVRAKLQEDIQRLTEQAKKDMLDELTKEQQSKYQKLLGEPLDRK